MINKVEVYSSLQSLPIIEFDDSEPIESDYIYLINPEGLGPVKAAISVMDSGSQDGVIPVGSNVSARNIILNLRPNPDWDTWTPEALAQVIYAYFIPKNPIKLVFDSDEIGSAYIEGIVESCEPNRFSKEPEYQISIICPDPYFTVDTPIAISDSVWAHDTWATNKRLITRAGNIPTGFKLRMTKSGGSTYGFNADLVIQMGNSIVAANPPISTFRLAYNSSGKIIELCSIQGKRYVRAIDPTTGVYSNVMDKVVDNSVWPMLKPGNNTISVTAGSTATLTNIIWELTYSERYGAL